MMAQMMEQQEALRKQAAAAGEEPDTDEETREAAPGFDETDQSTWGDPGRNDQCPCGSGKKFKHCHGRLT